MNTFKNIVIGIDAGGTHSRIILANTKGEIILFDKTVGLNPRTSPEGKKIVKQKLLDMISNAGYNVKNILKIVVGLAGYETSNDINWVKQILNIPEFKEITTFYNDAVIAHYAAFENNPGIIVNCGTGCFVYGKSEENQVFTTHYLPSFRGMSAGLLVHEFILQLMTGELETEDLVLTEKFLNYLNVQDKLELYKLFIENRLRFSRKFESELWAFAPHITKAACEGIPVARNICEKLVNELFTGIKLIKSFMSSGNINVAFNGGLLCTEFVKNLLKECISSHNQLQFCEPSFTPVEAAVLIGIESSVGLDDTIRQNIIR